MRVSLVSGDEVEVAEHSGDRALHGDGRGGVVDAPASPRRERHGATAGDARGEGVPATPGRRGRSANAPLGNNLNKKVSNL